MLATKDNTQFEISPPRHSAVFSYLINGQKLQCAISLNVPGDIMTPPIDQYDNVVMGGRTKTVFHRDLFDALGPGSRIKSAGHCSIREGKVHVHGGSVGFGIESKPEDAEIIGALLGI